MSLPLIFLNRVPVHVWGAGQGLGLIKDVPVGAVADFEGKQSVANAPAAA